MTGKAVPDSWRWASIERLLLEAHTVQNLSLYESAGSRAFSGGGGGGGWGVEDPELRRGSYAILEMIMVLCREREKEKREKKELRCFLGIDHGGFFSLQYSVDFNCG
jgi:hypothetical protein